jgi:triacylglycerol lipase
MSRSHFIIFTCFLSLLLPEGLAHSSSSTEDNATDQQCVVLLHGLGRSSVSMKGLEWRLEQEGYAVLNKSYPWMNFRIGELAAIAVEPGLEGCRQQGKSTINFVTHSLGGILLRQYLELNSIAGLGRVVMLAPPNQGSTRADHLLANELLGPLLPEPAQQLGTGEDSVPRQLGPVRFELGVIAGNNGRDLPSPGLEDIPNDGTVAVAETRVDGMQDFIVLEVDHSFLMWRSVVLDQVVTFLREGRFNHGLNPVDEQQATD